MFFLWPSIENLSQFVSVTFPGSFPSSSPSPSPQENTHFNQTRLLLIPRKYPNLLKFSFNHPKLFQCCLFYKDFPNSPSGKRSPSTTLPVLLQHTRAEHLRAKASEAQDVWSQADRSSNSILLFIGYVTPSK